MEGDEMKPTVILGPQMPKDIRRSCNSNWKNHLAHSPSMIFPRNVQYSQYYSLLRIPRRLLYVYYERKTYVQGSANGKINGVGIHLCFYPRVFSWTIPTQSASASRNQCIGVLFWISVRPSIHPSIDVYVLHTINKVRLTNNSLNAKEKRWIIGWTSV